MAKEMKTESVTIRMTPTAKFRLERLAEQDGRSVASYIERHAMTAPLDDDPPIELAKVLRHKPKR